MLTYFHQVALQCCLLIETRRPPRKISLSLSLILCGQKKAKSAVLCEGLSLSSLKGNPECYLTCDRPFISDKVCFQGHGKGFSMKLKLRITESPKALTQLKKIKIKINKQCPLNHLTWTLTTHVD